MQRRRPMLPQGGEMMRGAVSLVRRQAVDGENWIPFAHHPIAFDLGQNRRSGNRGGKSVAVDDGSLRQLAIEAHRVNQQMVRAGLQTYYRFPHGDSRSLINIDLVDAGSIDGGDSPGDGMLADAFGENFAPFCDQKLGIAQTSNSIPGIEDDRSRHNRTE